MVELTLADIGYCLCHYIAFLVPAALIALGIRGLKQIPSELSRKLLHVIAFSSPIVIMYYAGGWKTAVVVLAGFAVIVYPLLWAAEGYKGFARLLVERHPGEVKHSLLLLFLGSAFIIAVCWGVFDLPYIAAVGICMWGVGDAMAALVGKRFGRHHASLPLADSHKTIEGSLAMVLSSAVVGTAMLFSMGMSLLNAVIRALLTAILGAYVELITSNGNDTISVPLINCIVLLLLHILI